MLLALGLGKLLLSGFEIGTDDGFGPAHYLQLFLDIQSIEVAAEFLFDFRGGQVGVFQLDPTPVVSGPKDASVLKVRSFLRADTLLARASTRWSTASSGHIEFD